MTERQAARAARARGLLNGEEAGRLAPKRERRVCPACGKMFLPYGPQHKGFCCGCCAFAWGAAVEAGKATRMMRKGDRVVYYPDGKVGVIEAASAGRARVRMKDGRELYVTQRDVEKVQGLEVLHAAGCGKGKGWTGPRREVEDDNGD